MGKYEAAFLLPLGANKVLRDDGWNFETSDRISRDLIEILQEKWGFKFLESYLGIDSYVNDGMKMSVIFDDDKVEQISFQLYNGSLDVFRRLDLEGFAKSVESFIPKDSLG